MDELKRKFVIVVTTDSKDDARIIEADIIQELRCCFTFWESIRVSEVKADTTVMASKLRFMAELLEGYNGKNNDDKDERE